MESIIAAPGNEGGGSRGALDGESLGRHDATSPTAVRGRSRWCGWSVDVATDWLARHLRPRGAPERRLGCRVERDGEHEQHQAGRT
jgi:hypothetical protein